MWTSCCNSEAPGKSGWLVTNPTAIFTSLLVQNIYQLLARVLQREPHNIEIPSCIITAISHLQERQSKHDCQFQDYPKKKPLKKRVTQGLNLTYLLCSHNLLSILQIFIKQYYLKPSVVCCSVMLRCIFMTQGFNISTFPWIS